MPLPIRLTGAGGATFDTVVDNISNGQQFLVNVPFVVTGVQFDVNKNIISKSNVVTLGSDQFSLETSLSVYPNPANNELHIQKPSDVEIQKNTVYNHLGQKIMENETTDFSVSELSDGVYILKIQTSEGTINKKFIKN